MKPRRLVTHHATGCYAGVSVIHGVERDTPLTDAEMPPLVECLMLDGVYRVVEMTGSTERAVFYREVA